jgi:hypothetical protein
MLLGAPFFFGLSQRRQNKMKRFLALFGAFGAA